MRAEFFYIVLGLVIVLAGTFWDRFHVGLTRSARVPVRAWQGRTWLLVSGSLIVLTGVAYLLGPAGVGVRHFAERASAVFDMGYEMFGGVLLVLVGGVFLFAGRDKSDQPARLFGAGGIFFGVILISDALWKMRR